MRRIDLETWPRHEHFEVISAWDYPHFRGQRLFYVKHRLTSPKNKET